MNTDSGTAHDDSTTERNPELDSELAALQAAEEKAEWQRFLALGRQPSPGGNGRERQRYLLAQQRLRQFARLGITLELDEDGAPMPWATGTSARLPNDPWTLPTSLPTLKVRDAATLGRILRLWRRRNNLSPSAIATKSGQTARFVGQLERGASAASLEKILDVVDALDMELLLRPRRSGERG